MSFNPFSAVENYPGMLNKIAWFNFFAGLLCAILLFNRIPEVRDLLSSTLTVEFFGNHLSLWIVLIPFGVAFISRIVKLHDRISDILRIRLRYDVKYILIPIFTRAGVIVDERIEDGISKDRKGLMRRLFYRYASGTKENCKIDYHHVAMALDQFSWYWILIEVGFLASIAGVIAIGFSDHHVGSGLILLAIIIFFSALPIKNRLCADYSSIEVDEILSDPGRRNEVIQEITAFVNAL